MTNAEYIAKNGLSFQKDVVVKQESGKITVEFNGNTDSYYYMGHNGGILAFRAWLDDEYKEPVLDADEKRYLSNVIRPFKDRVSSICKKHYYECSEQIAICVNSVDKYSPDVILLPIFKKGTMYKNMAINHEYTLKELGL